MKNLDENQIRAVVQMAKHGLASKRPRRSGLDAARWDATMRVLLGWGLVQRDPADVWGRVTSVVLTDLGCDTACGWAMDRGQTNPSVILPDRVVFGGQTFQLIQPCASRSATPSTDISAAPWEVDDSGRSLYRFQVLSAPDAHGAAEILYQGSNRKTADCIAGSPDMLKALQSFPFKIGERATDEVYGARCRAWWEHVGYLAQKKAEGAEVAATTERPDSCTTHDD